MNAIATFIFLSCFLSFITQTLTNNEDSKDLYNEDSNDSAVLKEGKTENIININSNSRIIDEEVTERINYEIDVEGSEYGSHIDDDELEMFNDWAALDSDNQTLKEDGNHSSELDYGNGDEESLEDEKPQKSKSKKKIAMKKTNGDKFYWKHKKNGKTSKKKMSISQTKRYWKKNCCIRGKRTGVSRKTYLSDNLFQECRERIKTLPTRMLKNSSCRWIFWRCCEDKALRRFYVHFNSNSTCSSD